MLLVGKRRGTARRYADVKPEKPMALVDNQAKEKKPYDPDDPANQHPRWMYRDGDEAVAETPEQEKLLKSDGWFRTPAEAREANPGAYQNMVTPTKQVVEATHTFDYLFKELSDAKAAFHGLHERVASLEEWRGAGADAAVSTEPHEPADAVPEVSRTTVGGASRGVGRNRGG